MKKKLKELVDSHNDWVRSLGVDIDSEYHSFDGYDMPDYTCRPSLPTSDKIAGVGLKRKYATQVPAGKTIGVAYNKGPYMVVDSTDFKTMGKKV